MTSEMQVTTECITIGRLLKPFGVRGEMRVESLTDIPHFFENLPSVTLVAKNGHVLQTEVTQARPSGSYYLLSFSAFAAPEEAAAFRGALIQVPQDSVPPSSSEEFYQFELIGLTVRDELNRDLGCVEEIMDLPQHPVLVVRQEGTEHLIPATRHVVKHIDVNNKLITVARVEQWGILDAV
ncbi:MAG: ribosome maturation factor RimM [Nitrospirales bacterium]